MHDYYTNILRDSAALAKTAQKQLKVEFPRRIEFPKIAIKEHTSNAACTCS